MLGIEQVGIHDDFFELGGDSVLGIQIIAQAKHAGIQLTPQQIFQHPTVAEMAHYRHRQTTTDKTIFRACNRRGHADGKFNE